MRSVIAEGVKPIIRVPLRVLQGLQEGMPFWVFDREARMISRYPHFSLSLSLSLSLHPGPYLPLSARALSRRRRVGSQAQVSVCHVVAGRSRA